MTTKIKQEMENLAQEGVYMEQELAKHQTLTKTKNPVGAGNTELKKILTNYKHLT